MKIRFEYSNGRIYVQATEEDPAEKCISIIDNDFTRNYKEQAQELCEAVNNYSKALQGLQEVTDKLKQIAFAANSLPRRAANELLKLELNYSHYEEIINQIKNHK